MHTLTVTICIYIYLYLSVIRYHYEASTTHWENTLALGWSNWADVIQGAYIAKVCSACVWHNLASCWLPIG